MTEEELNKIIESPSLQDIIQSDDFYFQKGQDALNKWMAHDVSEELKDSIIKLSSDYNHFLKIAEVNPEVEEIRDLLFEIISYCDNRARDKNKYNKYEDKRTLADASVRMGNWTEGLVKLKFKHEEITAPSIINAFNYLLKPQENLTILSVNHREMISENLIQKSFVPDDFVKDLKGFFENYNLTTKNEDNYTSLLSSIIYSIMNEWKDDVVGLMASDGTGWQEGELQLESKWSGLIVWNSKKPTNGVKVRNFLRDKIEDGGSFPLYYSIGGNVVYRAHIIDFAINQSELDNLKIQPKLIKHFEPNFADYHDNKKSAKIVFVAESIEKIDSLAVSEFEFYKCQQPRQDNLSPIKSTPDDRIEVIPPTHSKKHTMSSKINLNQIFYGPPGTGKTYTTVEEAIRVVDPKYLETKRDRKELADYFRSLIYDEEQNPNGQILFTTFHQSLSYEDFIEGIKPNIVNFEDEDKSSGTDSENSGIDYILKDGIFKTAVNLAKKSTKSTVDFDQLWNSYLEELKSDSNEKIFTSVQSELKLDSIEPNGNSVNVRFKKSWNPDEPEGTRAFIVSKNMIERLFDAKVDGAEDNKRGRADVAKHVGSGRATHIYSVYKDFYFFALNIGAFSSGQRLNYVIIIDEINRGNVSSIFGELITLIEPDKRIGEVNELSAVLPYSREKFGVPSNLFIVGTMNTADRSVEALDTALRRRFSFTEMPPKYDLSGLQYQFAGNSGSLILETINKRIQKLMDRDHLIGHSYFLLDDDEDPETKLKASFYKNIIPLLQEYFYGDYAKIGAVLGEGFIYRSENDEDTLFGSGYEEIDYNEKEDYFIRDFRKYDSISAMINGVKTDLSFELAIKMLVN